MDMGTKTGSAGRESKDLQSTIGNSDPQSRTHLFDRPGNVQRLLRGFYIALAVLLGIDFWIHRHAHFAWESWPEFYAVFGFVACVALVAAAKYILRPLVRRREDYYD